MIEQSPTEKRDDGLGVEPTLWVRSEFGAIQAPGSKLPAAHRRAARRGLRVASVTAPTPAAEPDFGTLNHGLGRPPTEVEELARLRLRYRERFGVDAPIEPGNMSIQSRIAYLKALTIYLDEEVEKERQRIAAIRAMQPVAESLGFDVNDNWCIRARVRPEFVHRALAAKARAEGIADAAIAAAGVRVVIRNKSEN